MKAFEIIDKYKTNQKVVFGMQTNSEYIELPRRYSDYEEYKEYEDWPTEIYR